MPGYVNIGAHVGSGTMVDTWATVGSCAQIEERPPLRRRRYRRRTRAARRAPGHHRGRRLHRIPVHRRRGCHVGAEAVLGANVVLTASTPIVDVTGPEEVVTKGHVPPRAVVIPGMRPKRFAAGSTARRARSSSGSARHRQEDLPEPGAPQSRCCLRAPLIMGPMPRLSPAGPRRRCLLGCVCSDLGRGELPAITTHFDLLGPTTGGDPGRQYRQDGARYVHLRPPAALPGVGGGHSGLGRRHPSGASVGVHSAGCAARVVRRSTPRGPDAASDARTGPGCRAPSWCLGFSAG